MRLIGPNCDQLGPINIVYLKSPNAITNSFCLHKTVFWVLMCVQIPKHLNEKTILIALWSENCRLYMFRHILDLQ